MIWCGSGSRIIQISSRRQFESNKNGFLLSKKFRISKKIYCEDKKRSPIKNVNNITENTYLYTKRVQKL